ncbi:MAG: hypothetical protein J6Y62_08895 [Clostridia bacterium]|nr:hypothetical protein [Clostridia bacterium]
MTHVIYDFDNTIGVRFSDVDDGLAFLYLLSQTETVELLGVTTTYGNSREETVYLAHPEYFEDTRAMYTLSEADLGTGFLRASEAGSTELNLPVIKDPDAFKAHVYESWRSVSVPYRSRNNPFTLALQRAFGAVLDRAAAFLWNRGKVGVRYTGEGYGGHGS